jgi:hypothetical protein
MNSTQYQRFIYACSNIGIVIWSVVVFLQGNTIRRSMLIFIISLVAINLLLWVLFRAKNAGRLSDPKIEDSLSLDHDSNNQFENKTPGRNIAMPSKTVKRFCYICGNIGIVLWSGLSLLQATSVSRGILVFIVSLVGMNLLLWSLFRTKNARRLG